MRVLLSLDPPAWHLRHSRVVGEIAGWLALRVAVASPGVPLDRHLAEAAALLHDVDKALPADVTDRALRHGSRGAAWLEAHGHGELAEAVSLHPVTVLADDAGADALAAAPLEARIVAYADKRGRQVLVPMDARFERWERRHPEGWTAEVRSRVRSRAEALEREVCGLAGCRPEDVGRLPWTLAAIRAGRAATVPA
jgi:hypothetical protein